MAPNELTQYLSGRKYRGFNPLPFYSKAGDFVTHFFRDEECYADRLDDLLTVYLSLKDESFVGFKLKGVRVLCEKLGDFGFRILDGQGKPMLGMLFLAGSGLFATPDVIDHYRRFAEATKTIPLDEEDLQLSLTGCGS